jgi:hypothetical protein
MATTALIALKPLKSFASKVYSLTGINGYGKLIFVHTAMPSGLKNLQSTREISNIHGSNAIVLHTGKVESHAENIQTGYDCCIDEINNQFVTTEGYKIISRGNIKTGIITATAKDENVIQKINELSKFLKKEKGCTVVVCLSDMGFKNNYGTDDIAIAKKSKYLDFIIGGNTKNFHPQPFILLNENNEEVVIHTAAIDGLAFAKIAIEFDEHGKKKNISFCN